MTATNHMGTPANFSAPNISEADLFAFHQAHFSQDAIASFGATFINASNDSHGNTAYEMWDEEEDDLGYYEDGVKRTLTDEQIEIFRHSELEALRKEKEKQTNAKTSLSSDEAVDWRDGMSSHTPRPGTTSNTPSTTGNIKKKKKKKGAKRGRPEPKPDLRKRTWDVVEKGLDTLDYD